MGRGYFIVSGLLFLVMGLLAALVWNMPFAAFLWGAIAGGKLTAVGLSYYEERAK